MPNVFEEAYSSVETVDRLVQERIADSTATAESLQTTAIAVIERLSSVGFIPGSAPPPTPPDINPNISVNIDLDPVGPTSFGTITSQLPDSVVLEGVPDLTLPVIPEFNSSIASLNIPNPPPWTAPGAAPGRPEIGEVAIPDAPIITLPSLPTLEEISIPEFAGITLPVFDETEPAFQGSALPGILQWQEPTYQSEIIDEVIEKIRLLWSGGSGLPEAIEQAIVERAMSREDQIANREIDAVAEEFSLRGFTMPSGVQAARADQMRQDLAVKKLALNRDLTIKFAEWQIENVRLAIQQGIAAENVFVNLFTNMAERMFQAAKFQIESQIQIYGAQVSLYNAQINAYQIRAQVFDIQVKAALSYIEVFKAEVEAEIARGQINEQRVRTYSAQVQALMTGVEIFKAQMQGAAVEADVIRNVIEAYKADVQAYAERINADKVRFDAYEAQVRGEAAKAGIIDSEARAYAALIQGKVSLADIESKRADIYIQRNKLLLEAYVADLDTEKTRIQSQVGVIQAGAQAYTADTQRYSAQASAETAKAQVEVSAKEAELRTNISFYQAQVQAHVSNMEQMIRQAALVVDALKAAGSISSTLAAGAMAGVHVGATLSGSGGVSASGAYSESNSFQRSESRSENYNYEGT